MGLVCCGTQYQDLFWVTSRGFITHRQFHVFSTADSQHTIHHRYKACTLPNEIFHHAERSWFSFTVGISSSTLCSEPLLQEGSTRIGGRSTISLRLSSKWAGCNSPSVPSSSSHPPFSPETPSLFDPTGEWRDLRRPQNDEAEYEGELHREGLDTLGTSKDLV